MICFITALVCLFNAKEFHWRVMMVFMLLVCIAELSAIPLKAAYRANPIPANSNAWVFNVLLFFQISAFAIMFYKLIGKYGNSKLLVFGGTGVLFLLYVYETFSHARGIFDYNATTYTVMSVLFVLYSLYYYFLLITSEEYADLKFLPEFWWVTGTLFFFFGTTAINMFRSILVVQPLKNTLYLGYIDTTLIVILYGCWTYAFICKKWITLARK